MREFNRFRLDGSTLIGVPVFITFVCFTLFWSFCFFLFFLVGITQLEWIGGFYRLYSPFACRPWFIDRRLIPFFFCLFQIPPVHYVIIREGWEDGHRFVVVVVVLYFHRSSKRTWVNGCRHRFLSLWSKNKDKNVSLSFFFFFFFYKFIYPGYFQVHHLHAHHFVMLFCSTKRVEFKIYGRER